jgi:hypothetical protein
MISTDLPAKWKSAASLDQVAVTLLGVIAVLAAILAVVHTDRNLASAGAQAEASRLTTDIAARISATSITRDLGTQSADRVVLLLEMEGMDRVLVAQRDGDAAGSAIGLAQYDASKKLRAVLEATDQTTAGAPLDAYAVSLLKTSDQEFIAELDEQNRLVGLAEHAGAQDHTAVFAISLLALAGVLIGLAAVLRRGRAGWLSLGAAGAITGWAAVLALLAVI